MLITAEWVLPISRPPIRNGAVLVEGPIIREVGRLAEIEGLAPHAERFDFPGCTLMPGLVNAHTHLSLSAMEGLLEPDAFDRWLPRLVAAMHSWDAGDYAASASLGARRCLEAGVTVVGDIAYGPESAAAAADAGVGGVFYWEVLGIEAAGLYARLEEMEFPVASEGRNSDRIRCGLSPHSAYTSGPSLLAAVHEAAVEMGVPVAIHVAESKAETELLTRGTGPLAPTAERMARGFKAPGTGAVAYLDRLGVLDGVTAVHLGQSLPTDIPRLAATSRGIVTCPRSNRFLANHLPRINRMLLSGIPVGIGTDSAASNHDLDLMEDVRRLHEEDPSIPASRLLEIATAMGAVALGVEDRYGVMETGMRADMAVFCTGATSSPEEAVVRTGGRDTLNAVLSDGVWRISDGAHTEQDDALEPAVRLAVAKARAALV